MVARGASRPVQRSRLSAPWRTRTSRPSTTRDPPAAAHAASAVPPSRVDQVHQHRGRLEPARGRASSVGLGGRVEPHRGGVDHDVRRARAVGVGSPPGRGQLLAPARRCGSRPRPRPPPRAAPRPRPGPRPPAPSTSALLPAGASPSAAISPGASVLSASIPRSVKVSVLAAPTAVAAGLARVGQRERGLLVRDGHVQARVAGGGQRADRLLEPLRRQRQPEVAPGDPQLVAAPPAAWPASGCGRPGSPPPPAASSSALRG